MSSSGKARKPIGIGIAVAVAIGIIIAFSALGADTNDTTEAPAVIEETTGLSGEVKIGLILPLTGDLATHFL